MLRHIARGTCLLLVLAAVCNAAPNPEESEGPDAVLARERRTYRYYTARNCGRPGVPENGWSLYSRTTAGNKVLHSCKPGYLLVGAKLRICQSNGRWTPSLPQCRLVDCGDPGEPANGKKWLGTTTLGSYVKYKCMKGFQLVGYGYRRCLSSGVWSGKLPTCRAVGCPALDDPRNGKVDVSQRSGGFTATYSCNQGFVLRGSRTRVCVSGVWQGEAPVCQVIDCGRLSAPQNGAVQFESTTYTSIAFYQCSQGHILEGSESRTCQANGQWSGVAPTCNAIECPALRDIARGSVVVSSRSIGSTATYRCDSGYSLEGDSQRTCLAGGRWSGQEPSCQIVQCSSLSSPANGRVDVSGRTPGSQATYSCNAGYQLEGSQTRTCRNNGQWSSQPPVCRAILCSPLSAPTNGEVLVSGRTPGSQASYSCNPGFSLSGVTTRTCQNNGLWTGEPPVCVAITCPDLSAPANGEVRVLGNTPFSTATYVCSSGFVLEGVETRTCQRNGEWSDQAPICRSILCSPLSAPANGDVSVSGRTPGSQASYSCRPGFFLSGVVIRTCQSTGIWSFDPPVCVGIECPALSDPANGAVSVSGNTPTSTASYSCNSGFVLEGSQFRTCLGSGQWSDQPPVCRAIVCPVLTAPPNGRVTVFTRTLGSIATYSCNEGYSLDGASSRTCVQQGDSTAVWSDQEPRCVPIRCPRLSSPANGRVVAPTRTPGSRATYSCNDGYTLRGSQTRVCQSNAEWTGSEPECTLVDCGSLSSISNGRVELTTTTFGSTATYICDAGFSIVGTSIRTCLAVGVWSSQEPACRPSTCGSLANPANGQVTISGSSIGASATYTCNPGYTLRGVVSRVCLTNGQWSGTAATCEALTCPALQAPTNGRVVVSGLVFGSEARYSCDSGYSLEGEASRTCQENGAWSGIPPICQAIQCELLEFPDNGQVVQVGNTLGATGTYSCFPGFLLSGDDIRICQKSGEWSGSAPTCEPVDCGPLPHIVSGSVSFTTTTLGSQASYTCQEGFVLMGAAVRRCQIDGRWSGEEPTCESFTCGSLSDPNNGQVFTTGFEVGDTATYVCRDGYLLQGIEMRVCQRNGEWSGDAPFCQGVTCAVLVAPDNGLVSVGGVTVGSTASYSCLPGYVLRGSRLRRCRSNGAWSGLDPVCEAVDCPDLSDPTDGEVTLSGNTFGSTATYRCEVGYGLVGVSVRVCQADGSWSDETPTCQISTCNNLEPPQNGNIMTTSTQFGGRATYSCIEGYQLVGDEVRTCQSSGFWSGTTPFCSIVTCRLLRPPKDGRVFFSSISFGAVAAYECFPGYSLVGVVERTCQANGEWSEQEPSCERIDCGLLELPKNGDISFSRGTLFSSVATYNCDAPFQLVGGVTRVCQASRQWSGEAPFCESLFCEELQSPDNGLVVVPSRLPGSTATYSCNDGYILIGSQTRSCQNNGFWSGVVPICQPSDCGTLKPPRDGDVVLSGTSIGSTASYECFEGTILEGDEIRTCVDGGVWSGVEPVCTPIDCGSLDNIPNGFVDVEDTSFGSVAVYTCSSGFVLMGKGVRQCIENGEWSGNPPVCAEVDCGHLNNPANGEVILSGTSFGFTATYSCNKGFTSVGFLTRICQETGEWSGAEPQCISNQCSDLADPARGQVALTGREYGDTATYSCDSGYILSGDAVRTCQSNGQWSGDIPSCIPVDCGHPPFLQNGQFSLSTGTIGGSRATYSCFRGYELVGSSNTRTCLISGVWSSEPISCQIIDCGSLPSIANGEVTYSSTQIDSHARYSCDRRFDLVGVEIRICQDSGLWSAQAPFCFPQQAFTCTQLGAPVDGEVIISGFTEGSVASYSCNDGYSLVGVDSRTCLDPQGWSGSAPICLAVDCGILEPPLNGQVMLMGTVLGSLALYNCDLGYVLFGPNRRTCGPDGLWSSSEPVCLAVECGGLPNPASGFVTLTDVVLGSVATYSCQTDFSLRGSATRECARSGQWTGVAPSCESTAPDNCGDPGTPVDGLRQGDDFRIGATVYYECDSGFRLDGPGSRQCQQSGIWTGRLPQCVTATQTCEEGATVYDDCLRRCTCRNGYLVDCCRVRRDFATLEIAERQRYIQTVLTVASEPEFKPKYEALVAQYKASFDSLAQSTDAAVSQFFPWNRYFLLQYEDLLQEVDCRVTIPYWDWTVLPVSPYLAAVWSPDSGFGDSARTTDGCVENGPFRFDLFEVTPSAGGGCIRRDYRMQMFPTRAIVEQDLLTLPAEEYNRFHQFLQIFIHTNVRCFVGGQMCSDDAANDPAYILHLAQVDSIFSRWQAIDFDRFTAALVDDTTPLALSEEGFEVSDFSDISELPDEVSICYQPSDFKTHIPPSMQFLAQSLEAMTNDGNLRMTCVSNGDMANVGMTEDAADFMHEECDNTGS